MSAPAGSFRVSVESAGGYEFRVRFDQAGGALDDSAPPPLATDEPPPLGHNRGPGPTRLLAAAVGNCLAASLIFCLQKRKAPASVSAEVNVQLVRNDRNRLRVGKMSVTLTPSADVDPAALSACIPQFRDFCVVTESVRQGFEVDVEVAPASSSVR